MVLMWHLNMFLWWNMGNCSEIILVTLLTWRTGQSQTYRAHSCHKNRQKSSLPADSAYLIGRNRWSWTLSHMLWTWSPWHPHLTRPCSWRGWSSWRNHSWTSHSAKKRNIHFSHFFSCIHDIAYLESYHIISWTTNHLALLHPERPKLQTILAFICAIGFNSINLCASS